MVQKRKKKKGGNWETDVGKEKEGGNEGLVN